MTDIIPFNEFGTLDDLHFSNNSGRSIGGMPGQLHAPELDDLNDADHPLPRSLSIPAEFQRPAGAKRTTARAYRDSHTDTSDGMANTDVIDLRDRRGVHRKLGSAGPVKGRLVAAAMAIGATAAAGYSMMTSADQRTSTTLAAEHASVTGDAAEGIQIVSVEPAGASHPYTARRSRTGQRSLRSAPNARPAWPVRCS